MRGALGTSRSQIPATSSALADASGFRASGRERAASELFGFQRIAIGGAPGSGKTTLVAELEALTGYPIVELDELKSKSGERVPDGE